MEGIVYGIANINFRQNIVEFRNENRTPNCMQNSSDINMAPPVGLEKYGETAINQYSTPNETVVAATCNEDDEWQSDDDDELGAGGSERTARGERRGGCTFAERRHLPRASKESSLTSIKRRTIMKPAKHTSAIHKDFNNLKPADIKKIYMNKKLTNFRPSSLETIFEEPANSQNTEEYDQVRFVGVRKLRRTLACTDGFVFNNKALVKKRRAKIRKTFGRRLALKKISLEDFLEKLNSSMEDTDSAHQPNEEMDETCCIPIQTSLTTEQLEPTSSAAVISVLNMSSVQLHSTQNSS